MTKLCPACGGTGVSHRTASDPTNLGSEVKCLTCRGTGQVKVEDDSGDEFFGHIGLPESFFDQYKQDPEEKIEIPIRTSESFSEDTVMIVAPGEKPLWIPDRPVEMEEIHGDGETHIKVKAKGRVNEKEAKKRIAVAKVKK